MAGNHPCHCGPTTMCSDHPFCDHDRPPPSPAARTVEGWVVWYDELDRPAVGAAWFTARNRAELRRNELLYPERFTVRPATLTVRTEEGE